MSRPVGVALVGCGGMGARHLAGYLALRANGRTEVELVALCDSDDERRRHAAALVHSRTGERLPEFRSLADALSADAVHAVDLAVPTHLHRRLALQAFAADRDVLVEKPIALTVADARDMEDAARTSGRVLAIAENFRRVPGNRAFASWVAKEVVGSPYFTTSTLSLPARFVHPDGAGEWYRERSRAGSLAALEMGVHEMDLLHSWFGPVDEVTGVVRTFESMAHGRDGQPLPVSSDDSCFVTATTASGVVAQVTLTMAGHGEPFGQRLFVGSRGSITSDCWEAWQGGVLAVDGHAPVSTGDAVDRWVKELDPQTRSTLLPDGAWDPKALTVDTADPLRYGIAAEILDFALAVRDRRAPEVGAPEAIGALAAALAILESDLLRRAVRVAEVLDGTVRAWQDSLRRTADADHPA